jgi:predicted AlkP superfamily phosphohydrolase/phosphomutase
MSHARQRLLVIGLDGFDLALATRFMRQGALPNLSRLQSQSSRFTLDHGRDKFSGLAWEHFSTGRAPHDGARWSAVTFDPQTYAVSQDLAAERPFMADLAARSVVFDLPYCDLSQAPHVRGVTNWGAHDPGVEAAARPGGLHQELLSRFGPYPAKEWIYGFSWPSAEKTRAASAALSQAVEVRGRAARWLLGERLPDWDLGVVIVSEGHSTIEPLWHGVDPDHPLHPIESAVAAAAGLLQVYEAIDRLVGDLAQAFPDATIMAVAMHGMGPNDSDVAVMALLPEFLYRSAFGAPYMRDLSYPSSMPDGTPLLDENAFWDTVMLGAVPPYQPPATFLDHLRNGIARFTGLNVFSSRSSSSGIEWMPAERYSQFWPRMPAFALPAFYDGRIRFNVAGREAQGIVPIRDYETACNQMIESLNQCRNLLNGKKTIAEIHWPKHDANSVGTSEADLYVEWESAPLGLAHPRLGSIGPLPYRRTGGHTDAGGFLFINGSGATSGDYGPASSFDVVPTILDLLGEPQRAGISGNSLAPAMYASEKIDK